MIKQFHWVIYHNRDCEEKKSRYNKRISMILVNSVFLYADNTEYRCTHELYTILRFFSSIIGILLVLHVSLFCHNHDSMISIFEEDTVQCLNNKFTHCLNQANFRRIASNKTKSGPQCWSATGAHTYTHPIWLSWSTPPD